MVVQILTAIIAESLGYYIVKAYHRPNLWLFNIYELTEFLIIAYVAGFWVQAKAMKRFIFYGVLIGVCMWIATLMQLGINYFLTWFVIFSRAFLLLLYLWILFTNVIFGLKKLQSQPLFWMCFSLVIFYAITLPVFATLNYMVEKNYRAAHNLYNIILVLNIARYFFAGISFYLLGISKVKSAKVKA